MKKRLLLLFICLVTLLTLISTVTAAEVTDKDDAVKLLGVLGIMNGDEKGNLNLENNVTRAQFSKMLVTASPYKDNIPATAISTGFSDVEATHWAAPYVRVASTNKWIYGYSDGSFEPEANIKLEEAATMLLRVLGYTASDVTGVYPDGQLALYESLDLSKGISAKKGDIVTRNDCLYLFVNLLNAKTKAGQTYAQTLGLSLGADGKVDIYKIISDKMEGPYVLESTIDAIVKDASDYTVYRKDTSASISELQKYDVIYYSDVLKTIWAYADAVTGTYESSTVSGTIPTSVVVGGKSYTFENTEAAKAMSVYGEFKTDSVVTLLLGKDKKIVSVVSAGDYANIDSDDYLNFIESTLKGPFVVRTDYAALGLPKDGIKVTRNNKASSIDEIEKYDVVYYSEAACQIIVYSKTVSGTYTKAAPNANTPTQITVAGGTYTLANTEVAISVSNIGDFPPGSLVTLLLGRNDEVAYVLSMSEYAKDVYGIVIGTSSKLYNDENGKSYSAKTVDIMSTAGNTLSVQSNTTFYEGDVVKVSYDDKITVKTVKSDPVSGAVTNNSIGENPVASDINIIETDINGKNPDALFFSRLTGATLREDDVRFYVTDSEGKITDLILSDFSGDNYSYGIMLTAEDSSGFVSDDEDFDYSQTVNYIYEYQIGTKKHTLNSFTDYTVKTGPCVLKYSGQSLVAIESLTELKNVSLVTSFGMVDKNTLHLYSDNITVYTPSESKKSGLDYSTMPLSELLENSSDYNIKAYVDLSAKFGGRIRLIIAKPV